MQNPVINKEYGFVVVGGGMSGLCAAIAAARGGVKTALIQNRPCLGGNASSEIRMHICGADRHATVKNARETGILEELLLHNRYNNPQHSFSVQDIMFYDFAKRQDNLDIYLNTHITDAKTSGGRIKSVSGCQAGSEKKFNFTADYFADATGDGYLGYISGAEFMSGTEGREVFGEETAPQSTTKNVMGSTLMFTAKDTGAPCKFIKPDWAYTYTEADLKSRGHGEITSGYWWMETGGTELDTISDNELIRDELFKIVYGVWGHIKGDPSHGAENYALDWVGVLPGKRESRRLIGDFILNVNHLYKAEEFYDAVAYGGWGIDIHTDGGIKNRESAPFTSVALDKVYQIPYRCLYSKNIDNLFLAGRAISVSHLAFGSTRVMATCAVVGQAVGTAAAIAAHKKISPRGVLEHIDELQQTLLKNDAYIPNVKNTDPHDLAKKAKITASSFVAGGEPQNVVNGISRAVGEASNAYISNGIAECGESLTLDFGAATEISGLILKFDSDLSSELTITLSDSLRKRQKTFPKELVKDYDAVLYLGGKEVKTVAVRENIRRLNRLCFEKTVCDKIIIKLYATHGEKNITLFELRAYGE